MTLLIQTDSTFQFLPTITDTPTFSSSANASPPAAPDPGASQLQEIDFLSLVDLTFGRASLSFTAEASDPDGVESVSIRFDKTFRVEDPSGFVRDADRVLIPDFADPFDDNGQSTITLSLPAFNESGYYSILDVTVTDKAGNETVFAAADLAGLTSFTGFSISGGTPDHFAPTLTSLSMTPHVEFTGGPMGLTLTTGAVDTGIAGVMSVWVKLDKAMWQDHGHGFVLSDEYLVTDDRLDSFSDGWSSHTAQLTSVTQPGTYSIVQVRVVDYAGNSHVYTAAEIAALGGVTSFTIGTTPLPPPPTSYTPSTNFVLPDGALTIAATGKANIKLTGNALNNEIHGNAGKNTINAGAGKDKLNGLFGNDVLTGGNGKDAFAFSTKLDPKNNLDKITDFNVKDDSLQLDNAVFKKLGSGSSIKPKALLKSFFISDAKAKDANDFLIYNKKTGYLYYDADGSGAGKAVEFAVLKKGLALTSSDFFVV